MKKQELNERVFDELLKYASADYVENIDSQWPSGEEPDSEHTFSQEFNKKMELIFAEQKKRERMIKIKQSLVKAAVIVLLVLTASLFTVMTVDALRVKILNYFIEKREKSTTYFMNSESPVVILNAQDIALPTYLPNGYSMVSDGVIDDYYIAIYKDDAENEFILEVLAEDSIVGIDSEHVNVEHIKINNQPAEYYLKDKIGIISYIHNERIYVLSAPLDKDELIKIAESIK